MTDAVAPDVLPAIYGRAPIWQRVNLKERLIAAFVGMACLTVFVIAATLPPSPTGASTHTRLGLQPCAFYERTGLPCPSCGMTTSFAWFVRGNFLASAYVQPMGFVIAILAAATCWMSFYIAISARPVHRLVRLIPSRYYLIPLLTFGLAAWGWKMFLVLKHIDGWR